MSHENIHRSWLEKEWIVLGDFPRWISGLPEGITINSTGLSGTMEPFLGKKTPLGLTVDWPYLWYNVRPPSDVSWFISPSNYSYKYHKP